MIGQIIASDSTLRVIAAEDTADFARFDQSYADRRRSDERLRPNEKIAIIHDGTTYGKGLADQTRK